MEESSTELYVLSTAVPRLTAVNSHPKGCQEVGLIFNSSPFPFQLTSHTGHITITEECRKTFCDNHIDTDDGSQGHTSH